MAEAVLELVLENLSSLVGKELALFLGFHDDLERLASLLTTIKATLEDAEHKQFSDVAIQIWLQKLKDAALTLDDIMDECGCELLGMEFQRIRGVSNKVQIFGSLSSFNPKHVAFRYKIAKKMRRISKRLEEIGEERTKFHFTETVSERSGDSDWRQTTSFITEPQVYGREEDKDQIINFLVGVASRSENLSVYPILGLGGLGKTTLAQLIFNHERVVNHFELRIWVCVSDDFSLTRITKAIIEAVTQRSCDDLDLEPLQRMLQDLLRSKRYLLVLDDVWDDKQENWQKLKSVLACGTMGASILVTTRLSKVAAIMGTIPPHALSELPDSYCWELFRSRAFGANEVEPEELVFIGKEIVKKCRGVPLAAKALGGLLRFKREEKEWLNVKENNLWSLPQDEDSIMPALRLSYLNLPIKLRTCFAYCAIFPKDEIIKKENLIELWMTNGFISSSEILNAEDVGESVWNELYWRSFFQDIKTDECGKVKSFKIHDLVHDLAQFVAIDVCCVSKQNHVTTLSERIHHLSIYGKDSIPLHQVNSLRTYIKPSQRNYFGQICDDVLKCHSLRVLHYERWEPFIPSSIGHLKHLRYLNLSLGKFQTLPISVCKLWNLQILKLDYCKHLRKLPDNLVGLKGLQQLSLKGCFSLSRLPPHVGNLTSLRILNMYIVGKQRGSLLAELGPLKLKGDLLIKHMGKVKSVKDAKEANMFGKKLNKLRLSWDRYDEELELQENVEEILEVLQPDPKQLERVTIDGYKGAYFPKWMSSSSLHLLNFLELNDCGSCLKLPQLGKLPSLKIICLRNISNVKYLYEESDDGGVVFMSLELLSLRHLPNLTRISREGGENMFPHLSTLEIIECPKLLNVSAGFECFTCVKDILITGCREKVEGVNEALRHMTALGKLTLDDLPNLESLPHCLGNLSLLHDLTIHNCSKLRCLPTCLSRSLQYLTISGYTHPELKKRCEKEKGEDWPTIAHIPHLDLSTWR